MAGIWTGVDRLLDGAEDDWAVAAHGMQLLGVARRRQTGRPAPPAWVADQRHMAAVALALPGLLARVRDAGDGPILLLKGPEIATLYPKPTLRPFGDLDLLLADADPAQAALVASGFRVSPAPAAAPGWHHRSPLLLDGAPVRLEIHDRPSWLPWLTPPPVDELAAAAVPSRTGLAGIEALAPEHHALAVAAHSWRHGPLLRAGHLLDLALLADRCDPDALLRTARRWGLHRVWRTSSGAARALLDDGPGSVALAVGGRHLLELRERTILSLRLSQYAGALWAPTPKSAAFAVSATVYASLRPRDGGSWRAEVPALARRLRASGQPASRHRDLDP